MGPIKKPASTGSWVHSQRLDISLVDDAIFELHILEQFRHGFPDEGLIGPPASDFSKRASVFFGVLNERIPRSRFGDDLHTAFGDHFFVGPEGPAYIVSLQ